MKSKKWFAVLTAIKVESHLSISWIIEEDETGMTTHFLLIHAAVILKAPALIIEELLSINPASTLSKNKKVWILFIYLFFMKPALKCFTIF